MFGGAGCAESPKRQMSTVEKTFGLPRSGPSWARPKGRRTGCFQSDNRAPNYRLKPGKCVSFRRPLSKQFFDRRAVIDQLHRSLQRRHDLLVVVNSQGIADGRMQVGNLDRTVFRIGSVLV